MGETAAPGRGEGDHVEGGVGEGGGGQPIPSPGCWPGEGGSVGQVSCGEVLESDLSG